LLLIWEIFMNMTATELRLDHFRIYDVENQAAKGALQTKGQFDGKARPGALQWLDAFGARTMKNKEKLFNEQANLTWYRFLQESSEPTRMVQIRNQFGNNKLWIGKVEALLCPARALESGSEPRNGPDHFKVYRVLDYGTIPNLVVTLKDQFGSEKAKVLVPDFFAVPVLKTVGAKKYPVVNPSAHLVIYRTSENALAKRVAVRDQFGKWQFKTIRAVALAVPSLKLKWT
jgi:hypothetical protein